jgi:hypothetical protein
MKVSFDSLTFENTSLGEWEGEDGKEQDDTFGDFAVLPDMGLPALTSPSRRQRGTVNSGGMSIFRTQSPKGRISPTDSLVPLVTVDASSGVCFDARQHMSRRVTGHQNVARRVTGVRTPPTSHAPKSPFGNTKALLLAPFGEDSKFSKISPALAPEFFPTNVRKKQRNKTVNLGRIQQGVKAKPSAGFSEMSEHEQKRREYVQVPDRRITT